MIPNRRWFPQTLPERSAWYAIFAAQFSDVALSLGFTAADVTVVDADHALLQSIAAISMELDTYAAAVRQYRIIVTEGDIGDPTPAFPAMPGYVIAAAVPTGLFERLDNLVKRIRVAPNYTNEIGALLGIMTSPTPSPEPEPKPAIKASESFSVYKFSLNCTRMGYNAFKVQIQRSNSDTWQDAAFATSNPCEITVTPTTAGQPERIMVRAVLLEKNEPIGQPSDPTYVTVNP